MKPIYIELVNHGVANRFEFEDIEVIEINWRLNNYPKLYHHILKHEFEHEDGDYKTQDFVHDMTSRTPGLFKFMRDHLSSWTQVLPFYWSFKKRRLIYDISAISGWIMIVAITFGIFYILRWLL